MDRSQKKNHLKEGNIRKSRSTERNRQNDGKTQGRNQ